MSRFAGQHLACVRGERMVFAGLGFRLGAGDALVLIGPNGSGKSSLLRLMADLMRPAAGIVSWDGVDIACDREAHHRRVCYAGHLDLVKPALTAMENVYSWAQICGGGGAAQDRTGDALAAFGIGSLADVPGRFLSAGQRRRVNLARLIAAPAPLWLLDEPYTALDADGISRLEKIVRGHRQAGGVVVLSLHGRPKPEGSATLDLARFAPADAD